VRFLIGDTNFNDQELQDGEINYCISLVYGTVANAPPTGNFLPAAYAADNLAGLYARQADKSVGDLHIAYGNRFKQFQMLAQRLRARATNWLIPIYVGGELYSEKNATYANNDIIQTAAKIDGMNHAGTDARLGDESDASTGP